MNPEDIVFRGIINLSRGRPVRNFKEVFGEGGRQIIPAVPRSKPAIRRLENAILAPAGPRRG
jgi:hypothetical protein